MNRIYRLTPHFRLSHNPLFMLESRRVRWGESGRTLLRYNGRRVTAICAVLTLIWLLLAIGDREQAASADFTLLLLAVSLLAALALDYTSMSAALRSINSEVVSGRWDLLRLTALSGAQIVAAKHGAAQVRVWRVMALIVGLQIVVSLTIICGVLLLLIRDQFLAYFVPSELATAVTGQLMLVAGCIVFVIEPFWRMRAVTALGVAISARAHHPTSAVLSATGAVAALWLTQGLVALALAFGVTTLVLPLAVLEMTFNALVFCAPLIFLVVSSATVYGFYSVVQTWSLRRAERWIAAQSG